jgi:hypothetical protein
MLPAPQPWPPAIMELVEAFMAAGKASSVRGQMTVWIRKESGDYVIGVVVPKEETIRPSA